MVDGLARPLGLGRAHARRRIERALARLLAENPDYDVRPRWEEGGDGALVVLIDRWGCASVGTTERGVMRERHAATGMDDLLYRVMERATFDAAMRDELASRPNGEPPDDASWHRLLAIHRERLGRIRPHWGERRRREQERLLKR